MITIDRLRYFLAAARFEHVGRGAENVHVSPSVISSAIQTLEDDLGCKLFIRDRNRIKLSRHGHLLVERANKIIASIDELGRNFISDATELTGHFRIGASHFLMQEYLVQAFLKIQKQNPKLTVEFTSLDSGIAIAQVKAGLLDLALIFRSSYNESLDEIILDSGQFQIVVGNKNPVLKFNKKNIITEINKLPAIVFRTSSGGNFWENHPAFKTIGLNPKHTFFYDDTQTAIQLLKETHGWAFLPNSIYQKFKFLKKISFSKEYKAPVNISMIASNNINSASLREKLIAEIQIRLELESLNRNQN